MGEPVKIVELARNMIRLAGYEPDRDIAIEFVGPRPGEKLHEELFNDDEKPQQTSADRILRAVRTQPIDPVEVEDIVGRLESLVSSGDESGLAIRVVEMISGDARSQVVHERS
jgi:FlaA1/EpsC-like NDP-sugar epimerase